MSKSESGAQLLARLGCRPNLEVVEKSLFPEGLQTGSVVELYGAEGTGKTELLLHLVAKCILPPKWQTFELGGLNSKVIFVDTDYKFSIMRLVILLEKRITEMVSSKEDCRETLKSDEVEGFITKCLKNLSVLQCSSSQQLLCTLHSLEVIISTDPNIGCIMIDSISAFYWLDRCNYGDSGSAHEQTLNKIVDILEILSTKYNLIVFATKAAIFKGKIREGEKVDNSSPFGDVPPKGDAQTLTHVEYLGKKWNKFVTERLMMKMNASGEKTVFSVHQKSLCKTTKFTISDQGLQFI